MVSKIEVDTVVNQSGDQDSGIDLSTNDVVKVNIAGSEVARVDASGNLSLGNGSSTNDGAIHINGGTSAKNIVIECDRASDGQGLGNLQFHSAGTNVVQVSAERAAADNSADMVFYTATSGSLTERLRMTDDGKLLMGSSTYNNANVGVLINAVTGLVFATADGDSPLKINRKSSDGELVEFYQDTSKEGSLSVSGSTVSLVGFSGQHESSGIPTNTAAGTVVSTIDELDTYATGTTKEGQTRADHPKVKISDTAGDKTVYGVVDKFNADNKLIVSAVGISSVKVTGACAKGDLLESNGDGTAKVQSDDIVRSKTIGKVTIGNSGTGVKLVSCVLYCG